MATTTATTTKNIKIRIDNNWLDARDYQIEAFNNFQKPENFQRPYITESPYFTIYREKNKGIYLGIM